MGNIIIIIIQDLALILHPLCVCVLCERGDREGETVAEIEIGRENGDVVSLARKEGEGERKMEFYI